MYNYPPPIIHGIKKSEAELIEATNRTKLVHPPNKKQFWARIKLMLQTIRRWNKKQFPNNSETIHHPN